MNAPVHTVYMSALAPAAGFKDLDLVRLRVSVVDDEGRTLAAGSRGTIVAVYAEGAAYEVEFTSPVEALATIEIEKLEPAEPA